MPLCTSPDCTNGYSWVQVRAVKSPAIQSRPGPKWLLPVSKFEVQLAWNAISGRWWAQGCYRGLVWGPNRRLLFQRHRLLKRKVGQMHCSKGGLYWKRMLKPSSNLWVKPWVLRTYWTPLVPYKFLHNLHLFVCVEVLRPSQPNGVMSSVVSLPNHTFTGQT